MKSPLPVIELKINEEEESFVSAIALVSSPAIESSFLAFKDIQSFNFSDEKQELIGAAMIPEKPIYRTGNNGDYYVTFSKETIRNIAQVFAKKSLFHNTNLEHSIIPADSFVFQSYIVSEAQGISAPKGIDAADGSWIVGLKVNNQSVWQNIKNGSLTGFSVEGIFQLFPTDQTFNSEDFELEQAIKEFNKALEKLNNQNYSK